MASSIESGEAFIYAIPVHPVSRGVALGAAVIFVAVSLFLCSFVFVNFPVATDLFLLFLFFLALSASSAAFFLVLAFPPRSWGAWIECHRDDIRSVPRPLLRWIGEPSVSVPIDPQAQEILVCHASKDIFDKSNGTGRQLYPYGFRILIRRSNAHDRELKIETADRLTAHQAGILTECITAATGLPVRLVKREANSEGAVQELPWIPERNAVQLGCLLKLAFAATPLIGGIVVGSLRAEPVIAAAVGIALWLAQTAAIFISARLSHQKPSGTAKLYWFATIFTFSASYLMAYAIVFYMFRPR